MVHSLFDVSFEMVSLCHSWFEVIWSKEHLEECFAIALHEEEDDKQSIEDTSNKGKSIENLIKLPMIGVEYLPSDQPKAKATSRKGELIDNTNPWI